TVTLASSSTDVVVPASVTVAGSATTASFSATVSAVSSTQTGTLTATAGSVSKTFAIQLNASQPTLSINTSTISFGDVTLNTTATQSVTLTSAGTAAVTVNSATATGTGFSLSGATFPATLNPGQTASLGVKFDPTTSGSASGKVTISSNSSTNPTATVSLSGTGLATSYLVTLTWNAPSNSPDPVAGYNVYRAPTGTGSYQLMNSSPDTQTSYADSNVQSGLAYDYEVKSVDASGVESAPSNITTATIP
ncbi:MAG: choice-of-anchor D domain-containing protein, partial [Terracidiphilus sp.]